MYDAPSHFRQLLAQDRTLLRPAVYDAMSARLAQRAGFSCVGVAGYVVGASSCLSEPNLTLTDMASRAREIQGQITVPVAVDCGAGFGEAIQVYRCVREMERAGVGAFNIEDQVYPKRAHYHRDYREHTIDQEHMLEKIHAAVEARTNPDLVLTARTDTTRTHGYDEAVKRGNAYAKAGADLIMIFPNTLEEARRAPKDIDAPLIYVMSHGNRVGRPVIPVGELADMGYKIVSFSALSILAVYRALDRAFRELHDRGEVGLAEEDLRAARLGVEDLIGLPELYAIEERTTEKMAG